MVAGMFPWGLTSRNLRSQKEIMELIESTPMNPFSKSASETSTKLIQRMLEYNPLKRPSADEAVAFLSANSLPKCIRSSVSDQLKKKSLIKRPITRQFSLAIH